MKIIKNTLLPLILILGLTINVNAQDNFELENSIIWKISGKGLKSPSFIFGTIHLVPKKEYFFTKKMQKSLESCKTLALEIDLDIPLKKQLEIAKKIVLPNNKTLSDYITAEEYNKFSSYYLDSLKIKKSKFNRIQRILPIMSSGLILNELIKNPVTYEKILEKKAKKQKMDIIGLETIDFQLSIFEKIELSEQIKFFCKPDTFSNPLTEYNVLLKAYTKQNLNELHKLMEFDDFMEDLENDMLTQRNKNWIPLIDKLINTQPTFIAVGAAHLPGEYGVINLLRKEGYTVTAVK